MKSVNIESRVVCVIPAGWGMEAAEGALAAAQAVTRSEHKFDVLVVGEARDDGINRMAFRAGAQIVNAVELKGLAGHSADELASGLGQLLAGAGSNGEDLLFLTPPGPEGEELAAGMASYLKGQAVGRCQAIRLTDDGITATRSVWGGRKTLLLEVKSAPTFACLRAGKPELSDEPGTAVCHELEAEVVPFSTVSVDAEETGESLPPVESCKLVVSGGRGVGEDGFGLLEQIARKAKGTLGGSLPAVDAGMVPVVRQVGISGKFVNPALYFAVGISGTPQHLAGIGTEARIVAINKDPEAPIFSVAEVGVVGEWQELLPEVLEALEA